MKEKMLCRFNVGFGFCGYYKARTKGNLAGFNPDYVWIIHKQQIIQIDATFNPHFITSIDIARKGHFFLQFQVSQNLPSRPLFFSISS